MDYNPWDSKELDITEHTYMHAIFHCVRAYVYAYIYTPHLYPFICCFHVWAAMNSAAMSNWGACIFSIRAFVFSRYMVCIWIHIFLDT